MLLARGSSELGSRSARDFRRFRHTAQSLRKTVGGVQYFIEHFHASRINRATDTACLRMRKRDLPHLMSVRKNENVPRALRFTPFFLSRREKSMLDAISRGQTGDKVYLRHCNCGICAACTRLVPVLTGSRDTSKVLRQGRARARAIGRLIATANSRIVGPARHSRVLVARVCIIHALTIVPALRDDATYLKFHIRIDRSACRGEFRRARRSARIDCFR